MRVQIQRLSNSQGKDSKSAMIPRCAPERVKLEIPTLVDVVAHDRDGVVDLGMDTSRLVVGKVGTAAGRVGASVSRRNVRVIAAVVLGRHGVVELCVSMMAGEMMVVVDARLEDEERCKRRCACAVQHATSQVNLSHQKSHLERFNML